MSSGRPPSSKKTRSYRANTLLPAGADFSQLLEPPDKQVRDYWSHYLNMDSVFPANMASSFPVRIPSWMFSASDDSQLDERTSTDIIRIAQEVTLAARTTLPLNANDAKWTSSVHSKALQLLGMQNEIILLEQEEWMAITLPSEVLLSSNIPDFTVGFSVANLSPTTLRTLNKMALDGHYLFINEARQVFSPLLTVECKSFMESAFEAENQCAESQIKMLYKFSTMINKMSTLPVFGLTFVGPYFTLYMAYALPEASEEEYSPKYRFHRIWAGDVVSIHSSLDFQIILQKINSWMVNDALAVITTHI